MLLGDIVFRHFVRHYFTLIGIRRVLHALHYFGLKRVSFLEQFVDALRIRARLASQSLQIPRLAARARSQSFGLGRYDCHALALSWHPVLFQRRLYWSGLLQGRLLRHHFLRRRLLAHDFLRLGLLPFLIFLGRHSYSLPPVLSQSRPVIPYPRMARPIKWDSLNGQKCAVGTTLISLGPALEAIS